MEIKGANQAYNRFVNLDALEYRIIDFLAKSDNKYAEYLFKLLKYDTEDCLLQPNMSYQEKISLLYKNNGDASTERIFMSPYVDDAFDKQSSQLHIYISKIIPNNHISSTIDIGIEVVVHNKISNIFGDANEYNDFANPNDFDDDGNPIIIYKSRATEMLKCVLSALNGVFVAGVGTLQFNINVQNSDNKAQISLWNGKKFFGYSITMSTILSGVSESPDCGW